MTKLLLRLASLATIAALAGCATQTAVEVQRTTELRDEYLTVSSRYVHVPGYGLQGSYVRPANNWYFGTGLGLAGFIDTGSRFQDERTFPDMDTDLGVPLARFHFKFDSTALQSDSQHQFDKFLSVAGFDEDDTRLALVVGYADDIGPESYNLPLSQRRADRIALELSNAFPKTRFLAEGRGTHPRLINATTDEARAKNRRVEIFLLETQQ